jgi:hypothetical protein
MAFSFRSKIQVLGFNVRETVTIPFSAPCTVRAPHTGDTARKTIRQCDRGSFLPHNLTPWCMDNYIERPAGIPMMGSRKCDFRALLHR